MGTRLSTGTVRGLITPALALAMGGLVLAVYFCYSLHGTLARASINLKPFGSFCPNSLQQFDVLRDTAFI